MVTSPYAAPEDLKNKNITEATDIYAFDCFKKWFIVDVWLIKEAICATQINLKNTTNLLYARLLDH